MAGDLGILIQFLAAIYVTISWDNLMFHRFWSPDYYALVNRQLSVISKEFSSNKLEQLRNQIQKKECFLESKSRKRGVFMLLISLTLMVYIGFEKTLPVNYTPIDLQNHNVPLVALCFFSGVFLIVSHWTLHTWKKTIGCFFVVLIFFIVSLCFQSGMSYNTDVWNPCYCAKPLMVIILILPILYQLYVNWLYSKAYVVYLHIAITQEKDSYLSSKKGIDEGKEELISEDYNKVIKKLYVQNIKGDKALTTINDFLFERLKNVCNPPTPFTLLRVWWNNRKVDVTQGVEDVSEIEEALPIADTFTENENVLFNKLFSEYENLKPKISLKSFCNEKKVDYEKFHEYHKHKICEKNKLKNGLK